MYFFSVLHSQQSLDRVKLGRHSMAHDPKRQQVSLLGTAHPHHDLQVVHGAVY
jgi:hypothetical protein